MRVSHESAGWPPPYDTLNFSRSRNRIDNFQENIAVCGGSGLRLSPRGAGQLQHGMTLSCAANDAGCSVSLGSAAGVLRWAVHRRSGIPLVRCMRTAATVFYDPVRRAAAVATQAGAAFPAIWCCVRWSAVHRVPASGYTRRGGAVHQRALLRGGRRGAGYIPARVRRIRSAAREGRLWTASCVLRRRHTGGIAKSYHR